MWVVDGWIQQKTSSLSRIQWKGKQLHSKRNESRRRSKFSPHSLHLQAALCPANHTCSNLAVRETNPTVRCNNAETLPTEVLVMVTEGKGLDFGPWIRELTCGMAGFYVWKLQRGELDNNNKTDKEIKFIQHTVRKSRKAQLTDPPTVYWFGPTPPSLGSWIPNISNTGKNSGLKAEV